MWYNISAKIPACIATASFPPANLFVVPSRNHAIDFGNALPSLVLFPFPRTAINLFLHSEVWTVLPNAQFVNLPKIPGFLQTEILILSALAKICDNFSVFSTYFPASSLYSLKDLNPSFFTFKLFASFSSPFNPVLPSIFATMSALAPSNSSSFFCKVNAFSA